MARLGVRLDNNGEFTHKLYQDLAALAEDRGYEAVWVPEGGGFDSLTQLTAIATNTRRVKLATGILPVFSRTPMAIAMCAAGIASVSGGRFILGLGVGHQPSVEGRDGVKFRQPMSRLRETIQIVRRLLAGDTVTHHGRVFDLNNASLGAAAPATKVPIYLAALGPQMLELAGELADGVLLNWTALNYLKESISLISTGAAKAGRDISDIDIGGYVRVAVVNDLAAARTVLQNQISGYAGGHFYRSFFKQTGFQGAMAEAQSAKERGDTAAAAGAISVEMQDQVAVVGDEEHCRAEVEKRRDMGLQLPVIAPFPVGDTVASYKKTMAAFRG